jgi:hypothetical protein
MRFSIPGPNVIECDAGFGVRVKGRTGISYWESDKTIDVDSEVLAGPAGMVVYQHSIADWMTAEGQKLPVTPDDRGRVLENIRSAFRFRGFEIEVL